MLQRRLNRQPLNKKPASLILIAVKYSDSQLSEVGTQRCSLPLYLTQARSAIMVVCLFAVSIKIY